MHEEEVKTQVDKVLAADQILHTQLFGWNWRGPRLELIYNPDSSDCDTNDSANDSPANVDQGKIRKAKCRV